MRVDLAKKVLIVGVFGKDVELNFPNRAQSKKLREDLSKENVNHDQVFDEYLESLGMPKELLNDISDEDLLSILEALKPVEKKS